MTAAEKRALVKRLTEGKRRKKAERPKRLAAVEAEMLKLGEAYKLAKENCDHDLMREAREEIHRLGRERHKLMEGR